MARAITSTPSSIGPRRASRASRRNSGSSSRNSTPWLREAQLARAHVRAAADQRGRRRRVVRRAERPARHEPAAGRQDARHRLQPRDLERLVLDQRRQDAGQAPRQHRLAHPRRADHQQVVRTGGRDLERAPGERLAAHVVEVGNRHLVAAWRRQRQRPHLAVAQEGDGVLQHAARDRLDAVDQRHLAARLGRRRGAPRGRSGALPRRRPARRAAGRTLPSSAELAEQPPPHAGRLSGRRRRRPGWRARSPGRSRCPSCARWPAPG